MKKYRIREGNIINIGDDRLGGDVVIELPDDLAESLGARIEPFQCDGNTDPLENEQQ
jgi:hypothetical protein